MKSNCKFEDIVSVYNTLPPHEKLFLGNKFVDSPNTVFRYADIRNAEYAGFVELYDMKRNYGSHKGEVIIEVAICPQYRSIGILELLQNKAEEFVRSSTKYNKIVWYAKDANGRSIRCAEKLGYKKKFHESDHWVYEKVIRSTIHEDDELIIKAFNKKLNTADYGILINGKIYTGENIDWRKYKTISPKDFEKYFVGTCWDYAEYEAKQFEEIFGFKHTLNDLKEKEYSMYYMQIDDNNKCPTHTWITYKLNDKIYLFESSWKKYQGITKYNTEKEMMKDYIKKHKAFHKAKDNPIIVTKYNRNTKFGLTPNQFMRGCIKEGKVIYSEIPSISVDESYVKISLHENFNDSLSVYNQLSDDEKKLLSPRGKFIDSPNLIYRYNHLVNGKSIGFIEVYKLNGNSNSTGFITLAIVPKYRSKGISYILIKKAIDGCKSKGYSKLIYRIDNSNMASRTVAEKNGFILNRQGKSYSEYYLIIKDKKEEDIYND